MRARTRTSRRLLVLAVVLALPLAMMATASGAPPDCGPGKNRPDCPPDDPADEVALNCLLLDPAHNSVVNELEITDADGADCEDISAVPNDTTFNFDFAVDPPNLENTGWMLGIRNSVPGDWCGGDWTYDDNQGNPLIEGFGNAARFPASDGATLTLVVNEPRVVGDEDNCTTYVSSTKQDEATWADEDAASWVITLDRADRGKKYRGDFSITVTVTTTPPPA